MSRSFRFGLLPALLVLAQTISAQYLLRLDFQQMDPYIGKQLVTRVVEAGTGYEVGRKTITIESPAFFFDLYVMLHGRSYIIDYVIDVNESGDYDAPPVDHAWRQTLTDADGNDIITLTPDDNFFDTGLPDAFPYSQYDAVWGGSWHNLTFGSTDSIEAGMELACDSFYGFFSTKGVFGNPATLFYDTSGAITAGGDEFPDTISFGFDPPWTGQVQVVNGEINADMFFMGANLQFIGTLGAKQILCFYEVYFGGNFIAAGYFYLRELSINSSAPTLAIELNANAEVSCFGAADGFLETNAVGGTPGYQYDWSNGDTTALITDLEGGSFTLTVTDADGCVEQMNYDVSEPPQLVATWNHTQVTCAGLCDGSIDLIMTGGVPPYSYIWSTGSVTEDLTDLCAGAYLLTIVDATGCVATTVITIFEPDPLEMINISAVNESDGGANGSIEVEIIGGIPAYSYSWEKDGVFFSSEEDLFNLSAGVYILSVVDLQGCTIVSDSIIIQNVTAVPSLTTTFTWYPNPASECVYITAEEAVSLSLMTLDGKTIMQFAPAKEHKMSVSKYPKGMYLMKLNDGKGIELRKVIFN